MPWDIFLSDNLIPHLDASNLTIPPLSLKAARPTAFINNDQAFMLISGVTSKQEQCLVVEGGAVSLPGAGLSLEACSDAIRHQDGRELFNLQSDGQIVTVGGGKCVAKSQKLSADGEPMLELSDCDHNTSDAERIWWRFTPQNQIQAMSSPSHGKASNSHEGNLCMSLDGSGRPGEKNVAPDSIPRASSNVDNFAHNAARMVDGNPATYWASAINPEDHVTLQVDVGKNIPLTGVDIKWECAAKSFRVETLGEGGWIERFSTDDFQPLADASASSGLGKRLRASAGTKFPTTHIPLDGVRASAVRVILKSPAPSCETAGGERLFGIRELEVKTARRVPSLQRCDAAAGDARSRWFLTQVPEWNPSKRMPDFREQFL